MKIKREAAPCEVSFSPKRAELFLTWKFESINYHISAHRALLERSPEGSKKRFRMYNLYKQVCEHSLQVYRRCACRMYQCRNVKSQCLSLVKPKNKVTIQPQRRFTTFHLPLHPQQLVECLVYIKPSINTWWITTRNLLKFFIDLQVITILFSTKDNMFFWLKNIILLYEILKNF